MDTNFSEIQGQQPRREQRKPIDPNGLRFFLILSSIALIFWLLQLAYQYFIHHPGDLERAMILGSAYAGATLISVVLFSSAIFKWKPALMRYWRLRRYFGIAGFIFVVFHVGSVILFYYGGDYFAPFTPLNPIQNPIIFGSIAFYILMVMALTSSNWAVQKLGGRRWKNIHRLIYLGYPAAIFHYLLINPVELNTLPGYLLLITTALAVGGQLYWFFRIASQKKFKTLGSFIGFAIIIAIIIITYLAYK